MRIKNFTLLTLALFVMSVVAYAQKPNATQRVVTQKQQLLQAKRTGELTKDNFGAFKFAKPTLPQNMQKAKANKPVLPIAKKAPAKVAKQQNVFSSQLKGKTYRTSAQVYTYGFSQAMNGWTTIDADGDGNDWYILTAAESSIPGHDGEPGLMTSASYSGSALTPDNYLVSPKMKLDGKITFWASGQDASWAAEHFGVAVSTTGGTSAADFTMVQAWDMTAAPSLAPAANFSAPAGAFRSPRRVQGTWYQYEVDLSSYAGAEGYVAIRHFGCTDMFRLNVDDITLETSQLIDAYDPSLEIVPEKVTLPDGAEVTPYYTVDGILAVWNGDEWVDYTKKVKTINVAFVGTDVYLQGLSYNVQEGWVKGTLAGTKITVPSGQYVGSGVYLNGMSDEGDFEESYTFTVDNEAGTISADGLIAECNSPKETILYSYWITPVFSLTAPPDPRVTPPAGLVTEDWTIARYFYDGGDEYPEEKVLQIGFDGNDVYVQGFSYYSDYMEDENWIKGTLSEDGKSITFASSQYYGNYNESYDFYFAALDLASETLASSVTVAYDAEAGTITWPDNVLIVENSEEDALSLYGYFTEFVATIKGTAPAPLPAPDIVTTEWYFKSKSISSEETDYTYEVRVGIAGNDVFVQGIAEDLPDAWIKGTLDPATNKVTFPTNQHIGTYQYYFWEYDYFFAGYGENGYEDVVMDYDAEAKTLTMESPYFMLINAYWLLLDPNLVLTDVSLQEIPDVATVPAQPMITGSKFAGTNYPYVNVDIPTLDEEGNPILASKLSYQYFYKIGDTVTPLTLTTDLYMELTEDMTEIPYGFTDDWDIYNYRFFLNMDFSEWDQIGIQSIYRGGGEENKSEIFWYDIYQPEDAEIALEDGSDITTAINDLATKMHAQYNVPGNIILNLAEGSYTISAPIESIANVIINGTNATIDASGLNGPFIKLDGTKELAKKADGTDSDHKYVDSVYVSGVTITGLKDAFIKDNQKTLLNVLFVENSIIEMPAAGKNFIDFNGKGYVGEVKVQKSTIWAKDKNTGFFAQYGSRPKNVNGDLLQQFDVENSTIVNIANGKNFCDLKQNGTAQNVYTLKNDIFVNCGKNGQTVVGFNKGQTSATPIWTVTGNSFAWNDECVNEAEIQKAGQKDGQDIVQNCVEGLPGFKDAAAGDFTLAATSKQAKHKIGDPRWLQEYYAAAEDIVDIYLEFTEDSEISAPVLALVAEIEAADKSVGNITIKLAFDSYNTITKPLTVNKGIRIYGENAVINASKLTQPMIQMAKTPIVEKVESGQYVITDSIIIDNVIVEGLTKALFADNGKPYSYTSFTVENSLFQYDSQANVVLNMASSMAINLNILNSTFWSKTAGSANFIAMSGKRPWQTTGFEDETGKFICANNTFYNMAKSKQFMNTNTLKGQKYLYEFNSNIFVNTSNKKIYANMTNNKNQLTTDGKNTYLFGSKNYSDSDYDGVFFSETNYNGDAGLQDDPGFLNADNGDFTVNVSALQQKEETGDPRWLTYYEPTGISNVKADVEEGAWYTIQGVRVEQPTKGVFIHNGKKVVVK
jgi:hypothetical protein